MYPSSSSSSSQGSMGHSGLTRYGSAPGSFLTTTIDSVLGGVTRDFSAVGSEHSHPVAAHSRYFSGGDTSSLTSESTCKSNPLSDPKDHNKSTARRLQRSCGLNEADVDGDFSTASINLNSKFTSCGSLVRHSSSPAGFFNHLSSSTPATTNTGADNGFSDTKGVAGYTSKGVSDIGHQISRLTSQLSFTGQDPLLNVSEESENIADDIHIDNGRRKAAHSYATASFDMGLWEETNAIMFSPSPSKRAKSINCDVRCLNPEESQFSLSQTALEMATMEALLQAPQDSIHCKIRAKRGCATHPRSIAERDRRTRINGKLKKLQELVPNLDKQTSYADMLDLAMQHIKGLQNQVQNLNVELENCSCGCKAT